MEKENSPTSNTSPPIKVTKFTNLSESIDSDKKLEGSVVKIIPNTPPTILNSVKHFDVFFL